MPSIAVVIPNRNGRRWLPGLMASLRRQTRAPDDVLIVDDGSSDGSAALARELGARVLELGASRGFAGAVNRGFAAVDADAVALVNTDVELDPDWLERLEAALADPGTASVACKMLDLGRPGFVYDAGDVLRRDGACLQRGRFRPDDGRWDEPGEVFGACAGAALYRRAAVLAVGGFDERLGMYLEDVDLALRLRLAGWRCRYEPAVAHHAGGGSAGSLSRPPLAWVERNTLLLVAKAFPAAWWPLVLYRQTALAWHAARERRLIAHLEGALSALPVLPVMARERGRLKRAAVVPMAAVVPPAPLRDARLRRVWRDPPHPARPGQGVG